MILAFRSAEISLQRRFRMRKRSAAFVVVAAFFLGGARARASADGPPARPATTAAPPAPTPPPPGSASVAPAPAEPAAPRKGVRDVLVEHNAEINACYAASGLSPDVPEDQRAVVSFWIGRDGRVVGSRALPSRLAKPGDAARVDRVAACIATALRGWAFPRPEGPRTGFGTARVPASVGTPGAPSPLQPSAVTSKVQEALPSVRDCFTERLARRGELEGRIVVLWTIEADGAVSLSETKEDNVGDEALATCITRRVLDLRFAPPTQGAVDVEYPFVFRPKGGAPAPATAEKSLRPRAPGL
jgi:hypothetical protein